jgi:hypothetical protein
MGGADRDQASPQELAQRALKRLSSLAFGIASGGSIFNPERHQICRISRHASRCVAEPRRERTVS